MSDTPKRLTAEDLRVLRDLNNEGWQMSNDNAARLLDEVEALRQERDRFANLLVKADAMMINRRAGWRDGVAAARLVLTPPPDQS